MDRAAARWGALALTVLVAIAFRKGIEAALLSDDYVLTALAADSPPAWWFFVNPGGDGFFRPVGYLSLIATGWLAGGSVPVWRLAALAIHSINALLVWNLSRRLMPPARAWAAAALFAIHGSRPEAVVWIAGRFDLMAALFVLAGLRGFVARSTAVAAGCTLLAVFSKETGFALPLLALLWARVEGDSWRKCAKRASPLLALALAAFIYRWWILGGIGGYPGALSFTSAAKALCVRLWVVLVFPVNWSRSLPLSASAGLAAFLASLVIFRANPRPLFALFTLLSALPAVQQLLIGDDLQKSRLLYLPALGFCWMIAGAARPAVLAAALALHFAVLQHNIAIWRSVGELAELKCIENAQRRQAGKALRREPATVDGVYFFGNGLRECVEARTRGSRTPTVN